MQETRAQTSCEIIQGHCDARLGGRQRASTFHREIGLLQRKPPASPPIVGQFAQCLREAAEPTKAGRKKVLTASKKILK